MKRTILTLAAVALLVACRQASAESVTVDASGRGWINTVYGSEGNTPDGNYVAGSSTTGTLSRDHFDFPIPILSGTLTSAILSLDNPAYQGHSGGTNTFSVYSLGAYGTYGFSDIGTGTLYGSVSISADGTETISLDAAAIAGILADQGGTFSLGGVDSGESDSPALAYDFGYTGVGTVTSLTLVSVVPEPSSLVLLTIGSLALWFASRRRKA